MCEKLNIRPPSKATLKIQWIPYTYAEHDAGHAGGDKKHKHHKCDACCCCSSYVKTEGRRVE